MTSRNLFTREALAPPGPLEAAREALFLDLDGTLLGLRARPEDVAGDADLIALLAALSAGLGGRLAIISGRSIADVDRILGGVVANVAGVHGAERRDAAGVITRLPPPPGLDGVVRRLNAAAEKIPGVLVEPKGAAVALHFRLAPDFAAEAGSIARREARAAGLRVQHGDQVVELCAPGADKGDALKAFMMEPPFLDSVPVAVGDDLTDEHAFAEALRHGGRAVLVGPPRPTKAQARLADVAAVRAWLAGRA